MARYGIGVGEDAAKTVLWVSSVVGGAQSRFPDHECPYI
jgi:hypothetical protein